MAGAGKGLRNESSNPAVSCLSMVAVSFIDLSGMFRTRTIPVFNAKKITPCITTGVALSLTGNRIGHAGEMLFR